MVAAAPWSPPQLTGMGLRHATAAIFHCNLKSHSKELHVTILTFHLVTESQIRSTSPQLTGMSEQHASTAISQCHFACYLKSHRKEFCITTIVIFHSQVEEAQIRTTSIPLATKRVFFLSFFFRGAHNCPVIFQVYVTDKRSMQPLPFPTAIPLAT